MRRQAVVVWMLWFASLGATAGSGTTAPAQVPPEKALATMKPGEGLQVELFAHEPMLINPTSMDIDPWGRVWVAEAVNYRRKNFNRPILRPEGDRIVILIDQNGDGKADTSTVFYQGTDLYGPLGICVLPIPGAKSLTACRVLVCQSPDILEFWDRDGDGKADGPPNKFLTNFGGFDHDHGVHSILAGPDNKLYFTVGDSGVQGLQSRDGKGRKWTSNATDCRAGTVWRCDMDGTNLELIAHNFRNNYECCVDSFGEIWLSDNDDDGNQQTRICHVMPGGNYGYHPRGPGQSHWHEEQPGIVHKVLRTYFGSPTGICFYEGQLLPEAFRGQLIHADAGPREIRAFHRKAKGAGYELEKTLLLTSSDNWFRPSDVCVAPDGSIFVADWYDPGVGGHGMGDWIRGRIYRLTPKGHQGYQIPKVQLDTPEGFWSALRSPCLATRTLAMQSLPRMPEAFIQQCLNVGTNVDPIFLARIGWLHALLSGTSANASVVPPLDALAAQWMKHANEQIKAQGVRLWQTWVAQKNYELPPSLKWSAVLAPSAAARREYLLGMRHGDVHAIRQEWYTLAQMYDGQDHFYRAALNIACGTDPARRELLLADFEQHFPQWDDKTADLAWELRPKSVLTRVDRLLADASMTLPQKGRLIDIIAANDDLQAGKTLLKILRSDPANEVKARCLDNLRLFLPTKWQALAKSAEVQQAITELLKNPSTTPLGLGLAAAANDESAIAPIAQLVGQSGITPELRRDSIRTLGQLHHLPAVEALQTTVQTAGSTELAVAAIQALGQQTLSRSNTQVAARALESLKTLVSEQTPAEWRSAVLSALAVSPAGSAYLLDRHEKKQLPEAFVAEAGRLLRNSPFQALRNRAMLAFPPAGKLDPKKLPSPAALAQRHGNPEKGKTLLAASLKGEAQCLRCHMVRGVGGQIGPDLSMIGKKASKENLYESILMPSKAIADQFLQYTIETTKGQVLTGLIVGESETTLTLRDANGQDTVIPLKEIDSKTKSMVSIMPDNLVVTMTEEELVDLVEYLFTLKSASLTPDSWWIAGPFDNGPGDTGLDTLWPAEKAQPIDRTAKFVGKHQVTVPWRTVRTNTEGYVDLQAFYGRDSNQVTSILYRGIESPIDQEGTLLLGNDDGVKVFLNGKEIFVNRDHFAATRERHKIPVRLNKGRNDVLIKIVNGDGPYGFYFNLLAEQELKLLP